METKNDLAERMFNFAVDTCKFLKELPENPENLNIRYQLSKSVTSIGANYQEAQGGISRADFKNKIRISLKESREAFYWLRLLNKINLLKDTDKSERLIEESREIMLILGAIACKLEGKGEGNK